MRGALLNECLFKHVFGIIPAYAGSTHNRQCLVYCNWDHPRVCGEHSSDESGVGHVEGSSPRMRGAPLRFIAVNFRHGIIPAYAGSTQNWRNGLRRHWDHPRVCGEHFLEILVNADNTGSSPRMRGARCAANPVWAWGGIIPAYAGST